MQIIRINSGKYSAHMQNHGPIVVCERDTTGAAPARPRPRQARSDNLGHRMAAKTHRSHRSTWTRPRQSRHSDKRTNGPAVLHMRGSGILECTKGISVFSLVDLKDY